MSQWINAQLTAQETHSVLKRSENVVRMFKTFTKEYVLPGEIIF